MKKYKAILVIFIVILLVSGCGSTTVQNSSQAKGTQSTPQPQGTQKTIKIGLTTGPSSAQNIASAHFGDLVKQYTNGSVVVKVFPNSELGTSSALLQDLSNNTVQMTITATADTVVPQMQVFEIPYIFPNEDVAMKVANGQVANQIAQLFIPKGMRVLANWDSGYRDIMTSNRPITSINSMKGLRVRIINSPIWVNMFKDMGANPIPMDLNQVYTGLQQGVVDAVENPISNLYGGRFQEVTKYIAITQHSFGLATVLISEPFWKTLTSDEQKAIQKAATETTVYETDLTKKQDDQYLKEIEQKGVKMTNPPLDEFKEATKAIYTQVEPTVGKDLISQVQQAIQDAQK